MNIIYAEYNMYQNSIDIYTHTGYMLRIDCNKAENGIKTTPCSQCALNALAIDLNMQGCTLMARCKLGQTQKIYWRCRTKYKMHSFHLKRYNVIRHI